MLSLPSLIFCLMCRRSDRKRDKGLKIPDCVEYIRNIRYGSNKKYHMLDLCRPKTGTAKKIPVIISIHGGGYVYGSKEVYQFYCAHLASFGFAVVNFNYRLAPKYRFPAPLSDLNQVFKWVMAHAGQYSLDTDNVFLVGDSAGAQLASQYGVIYSSPEYRKIMEMKKPHLNIRALGLCCGLYDISPDENDPGKLSPDYFSHNPKQFGEKLNVLKYLGMDFPPSFILSAPGDFLLERNKAFDAFLTEQGIDHEFNIYGDEKTGHVFHVNMKDTAGHKANSDMIDFFNRFVAAVRS